VRTRARVAALAACAAIAGVALGAGAPPAGASPDAYVTYWQPGPGPNGCGQGGLASLDLSSGQGTTIGAPDPAYCTVFDLATAPDGKIYAIRGDATTATLRLQRVSASTGALTDLGAIGPIFVSGDQFGAYGGIEFDADGTLLVHGVLLDGRCNDAGAVGPQFRSCLYEVDPDDPGDATFIGPLFDAGSGPDFANGLAATCEGDLYAGLFAQEEEGPPVVTLAEIDRSDGSASPIGPTGNLVATESFDPESERLFGVGAGFGEEGPFALTMRLDDDTGAATTLAQVDEIGSTPVNFLIASTIDSLDECDEPEPPPAPQPVPVVAEPTFTG